jgi:hypothetical protein
MAEFECISTGPRMLMLPHDLPIHWRAQRTTQSVVLITISQLMSDITIRNAQGSRARVLLPSNAQGQQEEVPHALRFLSSLLICPVQSVLRYILSADEASILGVCRGK